MNLFGLLPLLEDTPDFQALVTRLGQPASLAQPLSVIESARGYVIAALQSVFAKSVTSPRPLLIVTPRAEPRQAAFSGFAGMEFGTRTGLAFRRT